jgi:bifunctional UDP-N-acetylglucosamine pyrophosphorylase/glucosamine-1-phosphate N-acetyltransferase
MKEIAALILAAGKGKRMRRDDIPKVLVPLADKPLLEHVINTVKRISVEKIVIIVGHRKEKVIEYFSGISNKIEFAHQDEQLGTGHAVMMAKDNLIDFKGDVLILAGDVPLLTTDTIESFINEHHKNKSQISVLSTTAANPTGYGRIVRDEKGSFIRITEEKDANDEIRKIDEINSGIFLVDSIKLFEYLSQLSNDNAQKEYYLTDIIEIAKKKNTNVFAFNLAKYEELQGINSPEDLKKAEEVYNNI